jgi:hypothetical protein
MTPSRTIIFYADVNLKNSAGATPPLKAHPVTTPSTEPGTALEAIRQKVSYNAAHHMQHDPM